MEKERESYITTGFLEFSGHPIFRQIHFLIRKSNFHTGQNVEMFHFFKRPLVNIQLSSVSKTLEDWKEAMTSN